MNAFKRVFLIVLDSVGIGEAPDANLFGDQGANTLGNIAKYVNGLDLPNLEAMGLGNIAEIMGVNPSHIPNSHYTKMQEASNGKDTMTGHWELMGLRIDHPFRTFPSGFPETLITELSNLTNRNVIGNKVASGTTIIEELGEEHLRTGALIVYTSADSVLQIAAHEKIVPVEELYQICEIARKLTLVDSVRVGRVIARPFIGSPGAFIRTANRHDYALKPIAETVMDTLKQENYDVIALGKIADIFDGEGITASIRTLDNDDGINKLNQKLGEPFEGLCFLNLVDFDAKYGHRRDPIGYANALEQFDQQIPNLLNKLSESDLLIITADHGNDPTFKGTDHTREYVPLIVHHKNIRKGKKLAIRNTFADVGATIADNFKVKLPQYGISFLNDILK